MRLALVLFLLVLIVILSVLIVVLLVLVFVLVVILIVLVVLVLVLIVVLHNKHSFFVIWELRTHYVRNQSFLCVFLALDCHTRWSSKAYKKVAKAMVDTITVGTLIHQSQGWST